MLQSHYQADSKPAYYIVCMKKLFLTGYIFFTLYILHFAAKSFCTFSYNTSKRMKNPRKIEK